MALGGHRTSGPCWRTPSQDYKVSWNGYKLHLDTADCGVPVSALLSSALMHDSRAAIPLSRLNAARVTNLYDIMDAVYCSQEIQEDSRSLGHVPLIDHNPRKGTKIDFAPHEAIRYNERTVAARSNARLKDEFGGNHVMVQGAPKVMTHLMLGVLALSRRPIDAIATMRSFAHHPLPCNSFAGANSPEFPEIMPFTQRGIAHPQRRPKFSLRESLQHPANSIRQGVLQEVRRTRTSSTPCTPQRWNALARARPGSPMSFG